MAVSGGAELDNGGGVVGGDEGADIRYEGDGMSHKSIYKADPAMPADQVGVEMQIGSDQLQEGDELVGCRRTGGWSHWSPSYWVGTSLPLSFWKTNYPVAEFQLRVRRTMRLNTTMSVVSGKFSTENRYPHKCPRCGGAAYVGFTSVECEKRCA